ncbi:lipopolysaccharide biosynthesis protein [Bradyrhizobium diazoefficiens]|uniref:lipopolysaccharide biosynthesis protein n=1 Tax=Bradyrhizobium diazoefficiens TaxID=1355477 RepID=UPI0027150F90|nr:oligosaccharide flippase family protein [Bradyrhizobium diazoefficiens]WLA54299.1 oligosaccharide flippase family protein [Bradyrhizobium diazoefficiens]
MLRRFLRNTTISAVAYGLAGVLGLFAVGLIARSYGLAVLGLIVLVRAFLPTGFLALIDLGVSELTTQSVVRGRMGDWTSASEKVSLLAVISAVTGTIAGIAVWLFAMPLSAVFKVMPDQTQSFVSILIVTAMVLPIAFVGLVAEGALKGFEEYGWLRLTEVGSNVAYVISIYAIFWHGGAFEWLAYSYLATIVAKYLVLAVVTLLLARRRPLRFRTWSTDSRRDILRRCWLMFNSRIVGSFQQTLPPLAVGILYGPAEVGAFDLITRLPRFIKTTMAPLYSAILPLSTRIDEGTDTRRLQILGRNGLILPAAVIIPALVIMALFSKDILRIWVGPQHADQWPWLAMSLFVPAVSSMLGAGQAALMVRPDFVGMNNQYLYLQVVLQYALTAVGLAWFQERAFVLGWAISPVVFAPVIARHMLSFMELPKSLFWEHVGRQAMVAAIILAAVACYKLYSAPESLVGLAFIGGVGCIAAWVLSFTLILSRGDRAMFSRLARALTHRS